MKTLIFLLSAICIFAGEVMDPVIRIDPNQIIKGNQKSSVYKSTALKYFRSHDFCEAFNPHMVRLNEELHAELLEVTTQLLIKSPAINKIDLDIIVAQPQNLISITQPDLKVKNSHDRIYAILNQNKYPLVGMEGTSLPNVTMIQLQEEITENRLILRVPVGERYLRTCPKLLADHPAIKYMTETGNCITGLDIGPLGMYYTLLKISRPEDQITANLLQLRAELALANFLYEAKKLKHKSCAMIITPELEKVLLPLLSKWKCGGRIFRCYK